MVDFRLAEVMHEERLREAEEWRRYRRNAVKAPPFRKRLLLRVGNRLIAFGTLLKAISASHTGTVS